MTDSERTIIMPRNGLSAGTRLNGIYEIERLIAVGGMGEVYKGRAIQTGDAVAIKMVRPDMAQDEAVVTLFRKEAAALHNVYNEAIVRYYVFTVDPGTQATYLAMEFVDGQPLSERLKQGPLSPEEVDLLRRRIASGLHAAHMLGITHRDVSPDNIILPGGQVGRAKIIDFGIAKSNLLGEKTVIGTGFAGKYNYVSPEQLGLFGGEVTGKSDIYSLGLVLAEALGGRPLDMGGTQMQILEKRRRVPDVASLDKSLQPLLARMLAPDPKDRPADMAEVASWQPKGKQAAAGGGVPWKALAGAAVLVLIAAGGFVGWQLLGQDGDAPTSTAPPVLAGRSDAPPAPSLQGVAPEPNAPDPPQARPGDTAPPAPQAPPTPQPPAGSFASGRQEPQQPPAQRRPASTSPPAATPAQIPPQAPAAPSQNTARAEPPAAAQVQVPPAAQLPPVTIPPVTVPPVAAPSAPGETKIATNTLDPEPRTPTERIERYIATYDGGACFFLWPTAIGDRRATIEGFGSSAPPFVAFDTAFKRSQGFEAQISLRSISTAQCPMADFLRQLGRGIDRSPVMQIGAFTMKSGDTLSGTVESDPKQNLAVLLVGDDGLVYNLANFTRREGGKASFNLRLQSTAAPGTPVRPQAVIALVSPAPLPTLSGPNPAPAGDVFPGLKQDASRIGGKLGVGIKYFRIE
ncbi:MAG TPA: protein kinase [Bosea sp. (in: a-proteobacteria)]|jgi:serine/threonine-protein kinase|uniref:serine/threonine-protein kinase n=1 Tax=Bosea sp. (in: a-proteobacteria) TaxID=1871050 RepID=UPI002E0F9149|nr:protein kinase [Bosea sp. (in: a-proteobacteria)]